ncbi:unnamed protein product, partial [Owenia fusiformis]
MMDSKHNILVAVFMVVVLCKIECCPKGWVERGSSCIVLELDSKAQPKAHVACTGLKAHVATIDSAEKQTFLSELMKERRVSTIWLDIRDVLEEGTFIDRYNKPITYSDWLPGAPSTGPEGELTDCVYYSIEGVGGWNDFNCAATFPYFCERETLCANDTCKNDGRCNEFDSSFNCTCKQGYFGE